MPAHKYQTSQEVRFWPGRFRDKAAGEVCVIVRLLPVEGGSPQYHIKAKASRTERVVRELQISPHDPQPAVSKGR
jgi:hypothetical protein